jgi:hypothetical protein
MIRPEQIPDEVVEAAVKADYEHHFRHSCKKWPEDCYEKEREGWRASQRLAIAAALNAWPGLKLVPSWELRTHARSVEAVLPLLKGEKA